MKVPFSVDLTGKTAIVTGGSGVLCSAMAYGLAVNGAKVAIIGRKELMKAHIAANGIDKKPGVDELLDYLRAHRIKTAVATATDPARTKDYLTRIGIYDKFDRIVCATMVENGKPKPDIYLYACEQIGEAPADCIAVEDSPNGVRSATDAGIRTVMVPDLAEPDADTAKRIAAKAGTLFDIILMFEDGDLS